MMAQAKRLTVRDATMVAVMLGFKLTMRQMERLAGNRKLPFQKGDDGRLTIAEDSLKAELEHVVKPAMQPKRGSKYQ